MNLEAGRYYFSAGGYNDNEQGDYRVSVQATVVEQSNDGGSIAVDLDNRGQGQVDASLVAGQTTLLSFEAASSGRTTIRTSALDRGVDTVMRVLDSDGNVVASGAYSELPLFGMTDVFTGPTIFDSHLALGNGTMFTSLTSDTDRAAALTSDDLFFTGANAMAANPLGAGPAKILAPAVFEEGSTGAHFDRVAFGAIGDLMLPEASGQVLEPIFLSAMDAGVLYDLGYTRVTAIPEPSTWAFMAIVVGGIIARRKLKRTERNSLAA